MDSDETRLVNRSVRFSNLISCEALEHEGAHANRETKYKKKFQYPLSDFQTIALF